MREYLAFLCGKAFLFWYNWCGTFSGEMALDLLAEMFFEVLDRDEDTRRKTMLKLAPYTRRDEAMKDKIRTPGR